MSWTPQARPKRFCKLAEIREGDGGWTVCLDGRPIRTPAKAVFKAPQAVAEAAAAEWAAQAEEIAPDAMPVTRAVNSAIDRVAPQRELVIEDIAGYGGTDLLCYRAEAPTALIARQADAWDPVIDWACERFDIRFVLAEGIMPAAQPPLTKAALRAEVAAYSDLGLTALSDLTALSGSLLLALTVSHGRLTADAAWAASRIDEEWQIEQWGRDEEADAVAARKQSDFFAAARLLSLIEA